MLDLKKWMVKVSQALMLKKIAHFDFTTTTTWASKGTFTISEDGLYHVTVQYVHSPNTGLAVSNSAYDFPIDIISESSTGGTLHGTAVLSAGTFKVFVKSTYANETNAVIIYKVMDV
jgi:hypothetical protein